MAGVIRKGVSFTVDTTWENSVHQGFAGLSGFAEGDSGENTFEGPPPSVRRNGGRDASPSPSYRSTGPPPSVHAAHARRDLLMTQSLRAGKAGKPARRTEVVEPVGGHAANSRRTPPLGPWPSSARGVRAWKVFMVTLMGACSRPKGAACWRALSLRTLPLTGRFNLSRTTQSGPWWKRRTASRSKPTRTPIPRPTRG